MRIVLIGTVESTAVTLRTMVKAGHSPIAVVSLDPTLAARHSDFVDLAPMALAAGAEFIPVRSVNAPDVVARIAALAPDWLVVAGWSQILHPPLMETATVGTVGYHPAPLPELRGRAVLAWTILLGRTWTAGSLFKLEPEVDSGEILAQERFDLDPRETLATLMEKHMRALAVMWADLLPRLVDGTAAGRVQDASQSSHCAKRTAADGRIDWDQDVGGIDRLVRAVTAPYPGAFSMCGEDKLIIWEAEPWTGPVHFGLPGQVVDIHDGALLIACRTGQALRVNRWEWVGPENPKPLRIADRLERR